MNTICIYTFWSLENVKVNSLFNLSNVYTQNNIFHTFMKVYTLKKNYNEIKTLIDIPIVQKPESQTIETKPLKMSIYDAWRSGRMELKIYQKFLKDGYPKNLVIEI